MQSANNTTINPQEPNGSAATITQPTPPGSAPTAAGPGVQPQSASTIPTDTDATNTAEDTATVTQPTPTART